MNTSKSHTLVRTLLAASLLTGLSVGLPANASPGQQNAEADAACREETRRVAVWPNGGSPRSTQFARFEDRVVQVCDGKIAAQLQRDMSSQR
jgi:hypothetical protein